MAVNSFVLEAMPKRVRASTGYDPQTQLGQTQLVLGIQALDIQRVAGGLAAL